MKNVRFINKPSVSSNSTKTENLKKNPHQVIEKSEGNTNNTTN